MRHFSAASCGKTLWRGFRLRRHAVPAMFLTLACVVCSAASAQNILVTGGEVQTNLAPVTYDSITVSGNSALGAPSTYTAAAPLTLTNSLSVIGSGVFNANADVIAGEIEILWDGMINLNSGTLTAGSMGLTGPRSFTRTSGNYSVSNLYLSWGATIDYGDGDSITGILQLYGGSLSRTRTINAGSFTVSNAATSNAATLDLIAGDSFSAEVSNSVGPRGVLNVNGDVTVRGELYSYGSGVVNLNSGTVTTSSLYLSGPNSVTRTGGHYSVDYLTLDEGATLNYGDGDSISSSLQLDGGSLSRTSPATINADDFFVANGTLDLITGDSFSGVWDSFVHSGGVVNVNGDITVGGDIRSYSGGVINLNNDLTVGGSIQSFSGGVINLNNFNLTAGGLSLSGPGLVTRTGGHYIVGDVSLSNGASLTYGDGDSITNHLSIDGISSSFAGYEPLSLNSLSITNGGVLSLHAFTGSGAFSNWGLRLLGDSQSFLETLITGSRITGTWGPMSVFYDPTSNYTFVTATAAVPEIDPAGIGSVMALVSGALALLERRKRSA
jgi:hypothetical protein